ncbi:hypothetical protein SUDANB66_06626 (plasmid) [Streptomyces sp. SudanB66_2053]
MVRAEREAKKAAGAQERIVTPQGKIANNTKVIAPKRTSLRAAESAELCGQERQARPLSRPTAHVTYVAVQLPKPEPLRVLYLTASPGVVETAIEHPDGSIETYGVWLRVDYEVRLP